MKCTCNQTTENCECHIPIKEKHAGLFSTDFSKILDSMVVKVNEDVEEDYIGFDITVEPKHYDEPDPDEMGYQSPEYCCPNCGRQPEEFEGAYYKINGEKYPRFENESKGSTMDGNYHDWTEVHCCVNCATVFEFDNGAY